MTNVSMISFEEWLKQNPDIAAEYGPTICEECGGDGEMLNYHKPD